MTVELENNLLSVLFCKLVAKVCLKYEGKLKGLGGYDGKFVYQSKVYNLLTINISSHPELFCQKGVLKNFESLAQVFSCEFCKISKNTFFTEHLRTTASNFIYDPKNQSVKFLWLDETWFLLCYFALFLALKVKNEKFLFCGLIRLSFLFILLRLWL